MRKLSKALLASALLATAVTASANPVSNEQRIDVVKEYIQDLGAANANAIVSLFAPGGEVISTSQGRVSASQFFNSFLPEVDHAEVSIGKIYKSINDDDHYSASFHFSWTMSDGSTGSGNYVDEFMFKPESNKLVAAYMFENIKM